MSTITQFILEQEGNFTLRPGQHLHLRHRTGSSTTIGSRIKAGILGEPRPGPNSKFFLFTDVISLAENVISWQSTGGADRYTCRTPHFLMHSRCTLVSVYRAISRTRVAQDWTSLSPIRKIHTSSSARHVPNFASLNTMHGHSFSAFSVPRSLNCVLCGDSAELTRKKM